MRKMKDSGVAWIGEIPEEWKCLRLKFTLTQPLQYGANASGSAYEDTLPRYIRITDIDENGNLKQDNKQSLQLDEALEYLLEDGDVLLARSGSVGKSFLYKKEDGLAAFAGYLIRARFNSNILLYKYFYYITQSYTYIHWQNYIFIQSTIQNISADKYSNFTLTLPSIKEQHRIVSYLDAKCAEIDNSMELVREGIDKLKEYKKSVITEAVTKGLDPDVPMKDSGVPWIGETPEGWRKIRLRYLCDISTGNKDTVDQNPDGIYPFFVRSPIIEKIDSYSFDGEAILMAGDGVGAGKVFHYFTGKFDYHQRVYNLYNFVNYISGKYLFYYLKVNFIRKIEEATAKSTVDSVRLPMLLDFPIVLGNIQEQLFIVHYLDAKCAEIDTLIAQKQALLDKLTEYKKSLIFECVTGKREVAA